MFIALLLTLLVSIFFLLGIILPKFIKNKNKLITISCGFTFIILLFLILFDLIPEIMEILNPINSKKNIVLILLSFCLGLFLLKLLDFFIPEHHHDHKEHEKNIQEHNNHFFHIGFITAISLTIHNILEGISIYITGLNSLKAGIIMALSVGLHNLPLGIEVSANLNINDNKKSMNILIMSLLILSSFSGAFLLYIFHAEFNIFLEGILLCITLGMILYIALFELFPEVQKNIAKKDMKIGLIIGILVSIIILVL